MNKLRLLNFFKMHVLQGSCFKHAASTDRASKNHCTALLCTRLLQEEQRSMATGTHQSGLFALHVEWCIVCSNQAQQYLDGD